MADTLLLIMFLGWANERDTKHFVRAVQTGKHLLRTQNVSVVSATNVARAGKLGNICVRNIVSSFAATFIVKCHSMTSSNVFVRGTGTNS